MFARSQSTICRLFNETTNVNEVLALDQLAVVLGKSQVEVKKTFGKRVLEEMRTRLKAGIPGNKITRGDFEWERALEIVQEVFVDSLHQGKQHQDFRGFGQGRGGHRYERGRGFHRGGCQGSISKHHIVRPVTDAGKTTTGQGTAF